MQVRPPSGARLVSCLFLLTLAAACGDDGTPLADADPGGGGPDASDALADGAVDDAPVVDAAVSDGLVEVDGALPLPDAHPGLPDAHPGVPDAHPGVPDAHPLPDAPVPVPDAHVPPPDAHVPEPDAATGQCHPLHLTAAAACTASMTGRVSACSYTSNGTPSQDGWVEVRRPDGSHGYYCSSVWTSSGGFFIVDDRLHLWSSSSSCCGGPPSTSSPPVTHPELGTLHGSTHMKPQEMTVATGGDLRQDPFAVIVSSPDAAAVYRASLAVWQSWAGDGQAHPAPDGSGSYYFPSFLVVNYVIIQSAGGEPMIVIGPEVSTDPNFNTPLGHPTLGACAGHGGAPMAFIGGTIVGTVLTNASGRFGYESTVTPTTLANAAELFNCYGITITSTEFGN